MDPRLSARTRLSAVGNANILPDLKTGEQIHQPICWVRGCFSMTCVFRFTIFLGFWFDLLDFDFLVGFWVGLGGFGFLEIDFWEFFGLGLVDF